jgi:class 3 adenylate cyclase
MRGIRLLPETIAGTPLRPLSLRFRDPVVESAFQTEAGERFRPQVLFTIVLGASTWALTGILLPLVYKIDALTVAVAIGAVEFAILFQLALLAQRKDWDFEQFISGGVNFVGGVSIIIIGGFVANVPEVVTAAVLVNMLFAFGLSRLGIVAGVVVTVPYVAVFAGLVLTGQLRGLGPFDVFLVLTGLLVAVLAGYLLESSTRSLFWQRRVNAAQRDQIAAEKEKSERLLQNMLPEPIAARLRESTALVADAHPNVSVLFADIVGFTGIAGRIGPSGTVALLNDLFSRFDDLATRHGLEKIKTIGDAYMAVAGAPDPMPDHARRAIDMGLDMLAEVAAFAAEEDRRVGLRVGVNSGPVVAGVIGRSRFSYDLWGDTVNVASRMESQGVEGTIQVTEATLHLLDDLFVAESRGVIEVRGKGPMTTFLIRPQAHEPAPSPAFTEFARR